MEMQKTRARARRWGRRKLEIRIGAVGRTVIKYAILTLLGILLFRAGAAAGLRERGYRAIGGEAFALLLPVLYYAVSTTVRDWIEDIREEARKGRR